MSDQAAMRPDATRGEDAKPATDQPVDPHAYGQEEGQRQDGPGIAPRREEASEATPVGSRAAARSGPGQGGGDESFGAHRGEPAAFARGEAKGSGASAGGGGAGTEDIDNDSMAGGGRAG